MNYYVIAGEASGDLHGANLIKAILKKDPSAKVRAWGGERMSNAGAEVVKHYKDLAYMGFTEVLLNLKIIRQNFRFCEQDILKYDPDVVILIDYPGFNLRMAKFLKNKGIKVFYYISPQIWAWHTSRVTKIKQFVDRMFVILPFEKAFYSERQVEVDFVGHPLLDELQTLKLAPDFLRNNGLEEKPIIAILPGSRKQEVQRMLPVMLEMVHQFPGYQFVIAGLSLHGEVFYRQFIQHPDAKLLLDQTYDLLGYAHAALVTSGTATLETALFDVPQVVCYKGGLLSYRIGKALVNVKYISLVNLILDKLAVEELIQHQFNTQNLKVALSKILDREERVKIRKDYDFLKEKLGGSGASERAAELMVARLKKNR